MYSMRKKSKTEQHRAATGNMKRKTSKVKQGRAAAYIKRKRAMGNKTEQQH